MPTDPIPPLIDVTELTPIQGHKTPRPDWYIVIGQWRSSWKIKFRWGKGACLTRGGAEKYAGELLRLGWSHLRIVRIPGEGT